LSGLNLPTLLNLGLPATVPPALTNWNTIMTTVASGAYSVQGLTAIPGGPFLSFGQVYAYAQNGQGLQSFFGPAKGISGALAPLATDVPGHVAAAGLTGSTTSASMGRADLVGRMSVPPSWTQAAPTGIRTLASVLPANLAAAPDVAMAGEGSMFSQMAMSSLAGRGLGAASFGSGGGGAARAVSSLVEADPAAATIIVIPAFED
jgi:PPE-repeat protein